MRIIIYIYIFISAFSLFSQTEKAAVKVLSRHQGNQILLRWATTTPSAWLKSIKYGYSLERYTISRNGVRLTTTEKISLGKNLILPDPLSNWESLATANDYAAILAQAMYGESFTVEGVNNQDGLMQIINKAREVEQRFAFGLFAADMNFEAAVKAGLGFVDSNVKANEDYFYKVIPNTPKEILEIESGGVFVKGVSKKEVLPKPIDLYSVGQDKSILLSWEYELFKNLYVAYFVERSEDGSNFQRLNKEPLVNMNDRPDSKVKKMIYIDSIAQNNKKYQYRVIGVSSFGEESAPSETTAASGFKKLEAVPHIKTHKLTADGGAEIVWEFKKEAENEITSFELNSGPTIKGPFKILQKGIPVNKRNVNVKKLAPSNYFSISAIGKNNQKTTSLTAFVQTIDSIPPIPPVGLQASIDTTGVVNIAWAKNLENDLLGYRVFRANIEKEEYSQLTISPISIENFTDHVQLKSLNAKVFYKLVAVDKRYNMSDFSEVLVVKKPDIVPPASPVFSKYFIEDGKVTLNWIPSNSEDVATHKLFRKSLNDNESDWELIFNAISEETYTDTSLKSNQRYRYAIFAEDESGLLSEPATPITLTAKGSKEIPKLIKRAAGIADRVNNKIDLSWALADQVAELSIYKAKNEEKPVLLRQYSAKIQVFEDNKVNPGNVYTYTFKALDNSGNTEFRKEIVTY